MVSQTPLVSPTEAVHIGYSQASPPPPPGEEFNAQHNQWEQLPPGWSTAVSPTDGRIYYWETATGRTSWTHPQAPTSAASIGTPPPSIDNNSRRRPWNMFTTRNEFHDTPWNATRRPDNHQCYAVTALVLCLPVGLFAVYQSICVDRAWSESRYGDAVNHSRQASQYACFGTFAGALFWLWYFLDIDRDQMFDWFQFD